MERPEIVTDDHLAFLDALRGNGPLDLFGSMPDLIERFNLSCAEARIIATYWVKTFG